MQKPLLRIPYTGPLPPPTIIPRNANTLTGAVQALSHFLTAPQPAGLQNASTRKNRTVLLTGAGISVASGLADYRGTNGTYTLNKTYRPIYYNEFTSSHEARKRYWARSFLGWTNLHKSRPNAAHHAIGELGQLGQISSVITQSQSITMHDVARILTRTDVDSFHPMAHPDLPTLELHGYLRSAVCITCRTEYPRSDFQAQLSKMNPAWAEFLAEMIESGALDTEDPAERRAKGLRSNPDGDVDVPDAPYTTFRYPPCPTCLATPPYLPDGKAARVEVDSDGAYLPSSTAGILKPAVVMFGESIATRVKDSAEHAIDEASRILVLGSSLATYSAWRLVKRAKESGMPIGILNLGGVRGEDTLTAALSSGNKGDECVRCSFPAEKVLPLVIRDLRG
ncbi:hypothetical protein MRB53_041625 [Persea americana]|nr:hypothetical protein MRB53_041625 [Persea americana]